MLELEEHSKNKDVSLSLMTRPSLPLQYIPLVEKTSFAAVVWLLFAADLAPRNSDSSKWPILNAAVKNRSKKEHYLLRSNHNRSK